MYTACLPDIFNLILFLINDIIILGSGGLEINDIIISGSGGLEILIILLYQDLED